VKTLLTGCGIPLLLFALFVGGYAWIFVPRFEPDWLAYVFAGVCSLLICMAIGAVKTLFRTRSIAGALRKARMGLVPGEKELTLVEGEIVAVGETINTPFSSRPCVSYEYELYRIVSMREDRRLDSSDRGTDSSTSKDPCAFGLAKTEYVIRASRGNVRPLGYPTLDHFTKGSCQFSEHFLEDPYGRELLARLGVTEAELPDVKQRVETYLREEHFQEAAGLGLVTVLAGLAEAIEEDTETLRKDWKVRHPENLDDVTLVETRLEAGQQVCALGKWDTARSGLHPPVELIPGDLNNAQRVLVASKRSSAVFGLFFAVLMSAILIGFVWASPPPEEADPLKGETFQSFLQSASADDIREMCQGGKVDVNQLDPFGNPPIFLVREADKLQALLDCGADPNLRDGDGKTKLSEVSRYGDVQSARALLAAGAEVNAEIPHLSRGWTAMVSAYTAGRAEVVAVLAEAGAVDERVTAATGDALAENSPPMQTVREYVAAVQSGDAAAISGLRTGVSENWLEGVDLELWKKSRSGEPKLRQGFGNTRAATIELEPEEGEGYRPRWSYHLEYFAEGDAEGKWMILREWSLVSPE